MKHGVFNGKNKALTFSFDDGNVDDIRLIEIMNKYGLKGTFNLNSGKMTHANFWRFSDVKDVYHINFTDCPDLYKGHEVACHSYTHPDLTKLDRNTVFNEIKTDKLLLDLKGRCPIVHLKDYNGKEKGNGFSYKSAGSGVVDIKGVIEAAKAADTEWLIVEQDDPEEGKTPMQCAEESAIYVLKNI